MDDPRTTLLEVLDAWWDPPEDLVCQLPRGGTMLSYVGHADVTRALIETDPEWSWEPMATDDHGRPVLERDEQGRPVGLWAWLTVCGVRRPAYGSCKPGAPEAIKELIGDSLRNGAMRHGFCGGLWSRADRADAGPAQVTPEQVQQIVQAASDAGLDADHAKTILHGVAGVWSSKEVPAEKFGLVIQAMRAAGAEKVKAVADQLGGEVLAA